MCCHGGGRPLDLDQRTAAGAGARSDRGQRAELRAISHSDRKSDQVDAEKLARYARLDPNILRPISHRTVEQQENLTLIRARELLVRLRTAAVNAVRGLTKACGYRMPASSTRCFARRGQAVMPPGLQRALGPVLEQIAEMTIKIKQYDREIQRMTQTEYAETQPLLTIQGVGHSPPSPSS
jgi:transposase